MEVPERIRRALRDFASKLRAALPDAEAYLFGSYARGDWLHDSDLDIVVVSRAFEG
ncbi:MAG: nucleotidyltransferase domain-containing protein, partial [Thermoprotei archaeon]